MPSSPLVRAARCCLLGIVALLPLVPSDGTPGAAKHLALLGLAFLAGALLAADALAGRSAPALGTPTDLALGTWLATVVPSALLAVHGGRPSFQLGLHAALGLCYLAALKSLRTSRDVAVLAVAVLACAVTISVYGLIGYREFVADGAAEPERAAYLSTPFFAHSYLAAQYLVMPFVGGLVLLAEQRPRLAARTLVALALVPIGAFLLVIGSRGAWLAIALGLGTSAVLGARTASAAWGLRGLLVLVLAKVAAWTVLLAVLVVLASAVGLLGPGAGAVFVDRLLLLFDPQATGHNFSRLALWRDTLALAADHLPTGVGVGGFGALLPRYHPSPETLTHAHNQFLHVLAELGLVGLLAFLYLLRAARHAAARGAAWLTDDQQRRGLFHASVAALTAGLVYFLFETPLQWVEAGSLLFVLLAVMSRAGCLSRDAQASRPWTFAGLVVGGAALAVAAPTHAAYMHAAWLEAEALREAALGATAPTVPGERADSTGAADIRSTSDVALRVAQARGHTERALVLLAEADARYPHTASVPAQAALLRHALGDDEGALALYRVADARVPGTFRVNDAIGSLLLDLGRPAEAVAPLRAAMLAHRGFGSMGTYARLARAYNQAGRSEEAWFAYTDLVQLWAYQSIEPKILLEAASTLLALRRAPDFAALLLDEYARRVGAARIGADETYTRLRERVEHQASQPKRRFVREPGM